MRLEMWNGKLENVIDKFCAWEFIKVFAKNKQEITFYNTSLL